MVLPGSIGERPGRCANSILEQVLEINPDNAKAREVLDRIKARETPAAEAETAAAARPC